MGGSGNGEYSMAGRTRALIESRMKQRSLAQLERDTGMENIGRRLNQAAKSAYVPMELLGKISDATGITVGELIVAMFDDAGYERYLPYKNLDATAIQMAMTMMLASPEERNMVASTLAWIRSVSGKAQGG